MKILHIFNELRPSGAEMMLASAGHIFNAEGRENHILATADNIGSFQGKLKEAGYKIHHLPFKKSPVFFKNVRDLLKEQGFDVVHIHSERASLWYGIVAVSTGAKCVRSIHSEFLFKGKVRLLFMLRRRLLSWIGTTHIACSKRVARHEKKQFKNKTLVIENWIDPNRIAKVTSQNRLAARADLGLDEETFAIVSIGNCAAVKNHEAIIHAVEGFRKTADIQYFHCGDEAGGQDERGLAKELGVQDNIAFLGAVSKIDHYLLAADAFVSSSYFEGGPITLLEAGAAGIQCITTRVGLAEEFEDEKAVHFMTTQASDLVKVMKQIAKRPLEERLAEGQSLSKMVLKRFIPAVGAQSYVMTYKNER